MQAVMWLVFAGSLGLASLLSHPPELGGQQRVTGPTQSVGALTFQMPHGWKEVADRTNGGIVRAYEDPTNDRGRTISLQTTNLPMVMYPKEFIAKTGIPTTLSIPGDDSSGEPGNARKIEMAGHNGLITGGSFVASLSDGATRRNVRGRSYFATTVLLDNNIYPGVVRNSIPKTDF